MDLENRVVVLIDMDCFYCQVEEKLNPELKGKPIAVVQYNPWKGGGIIAVNYVARAMGVTRHMRGDEAKEKCPEIQLPSVPCQRGKADISKYREAGKDVAKVLQRYTPLLERASIDEAYLDITTLVHETVKTLTMSAISTDKLPNTFALGYDSINDFVNDVQSGGNDSIDFDYGNARRLLVGAIVVSEIRDAVFKETGYQCSAGISHNKILAKLVCGMNKPNKQTILPKHSINILYKTLPVRKVKCLGGKFGQSVCDTLKIQHMAELQQFSEKELQMRFDEKNGTWLYNIAHGTDLEPVQARFNPKSIGCCKQLRGKSALTDIDSLRKWLKDLGDEIEDRLEKDALETNRTPKQMVVSFTAQQTDGKDTSSSRSYNFAPDDELCAELFSSKAFELVMESAEGCKAKDNEPNRKLKAIIKFLGISVGKFEDNTDKKSKKIKDYFAAGSAKVKKKSPVKNKIGKANRIEEIDKENKKRNEGKEYILQKFLKVEDGNQRAAINNTVNDIYNNEQTNFSVNLKDKNETQSINNKGSMTSEGQPKETVIALDKQESFFAKFLLSKSDNQIAGPSGTKKEPVRPITPICKIVNENDGSGDNSNDTEYSGSTINDEINKSIALFDEDPDDISRVSNMRTLLQDTKLKNDDDNELSNQESIRSSPKIVVPEKQVIMEVQTFDCSDCGKTLPLASFETHADYHLALKLRDEERELARKEIKLNKETKTRNEESSSKDTKSRIQDTKRKKEKKEDKNRSVSSITSFFVKLDDSIPTEVCSECGKKIQIEKFAEHLDFHEAQKINRQINNKPINNFSASHSNSSKRKRKSTSPLKKPKMPCTSIDSFIVNR